MDSQGLETFLGQAAMLARHADWVRAAARPMVGIARSTMPLSPGRSRLGGAPDLPPGTSWPHHEQGPYRFLAQVNFSEVRAPDTGLPSQGVLSVFVADDEEQNVFWKEPHFIRALYTADPRGLVRVSPPADLNEPPGFSIRFGEVSIDLPRDRIQRSDWPGGLAEPAVAWWRTQRVRQEAYLLGYPAVSTLAYDPTPGAGWASLLTLSSIDALDWSWGGGAYLHLFIEQSRLLVGDFSQIVADVG